MMPPRCFCYSLLLVLLLCHEDPFLFSGMGVAWSEAAIFSGGLACQSEQRTSETPASRSRLVLGEAHRRGDREISIPLRFTAAEGETVGILRAEVIVPESPWKFRNLHLLENSPLQAKAKDREEKIEGKSSAQIVIELEFSAGSRAIRDGLLGFLRFSSRKRGIAEPPSLSVRRVDTAVPEPEILRENPSRQSSPLPAEPPLNPVQSCFFFAH